MTGMAPAALRRAQHFEPEPRAVLEAAAILVAAPVLERRMKLRDEIAMRRVDLDAIEPRLPRPRSGGGEGRDRLGDAGLGHFLRHDRGVRHLIDGMRDGRGRDRRLAANVPARMPAGMSQLNRRLGAPRMDRRGEPREPRQEPVVMDAELVKPVPPHPLRRRHLAGDEPDPAGDARAVVVDRVVGDEALGIGEPRRHRRHDDAVAHLHRADPRRGEEDVHARRVPQPPRRWNPLPSGRAVRSTRPEIASLRSQ